MTSDRYYYGTLRCYTSPTFAHKQMLQKSGRDQSFAQFQFPHEGHEWQQTAKGVVDSFYKLNNQYIARGFSENAYLHFLRNDWRPKAMRFLASECAGEKELVPLELRDIIKWVDDELEMDAMTWPPIYIESPLNGGTLITPIDVSTTGRPV